MLPHLASMRFLVKQPKASLLCVDASPKQWRGTAMPHIEPVVSQIPQAPARLPSSFRKE